MAAIRLTAVWKTSLRRPSSFVRFCNTKSGDEGNETADGGSSVTSESSSTKNAPNMRGEETKGALKSFLAQTGASAEGDGLWAKLRREATSEKSEPRPWTQAGAQRPQRPAVPGGGGAGGGGVGGGGVGGGQQRSTEPYKSFNPRTTSYPKKFTGAGPGRKSEDGAPPSGVSTYLGGARKGNKKSSNEDDKVATYDIKALYAEHMKTNPIEIIRLAKMAGGEINTAGMDEMETFLARVWMESYSTTDDVVRDVMVLPGFKKVQIPQPRSIRELVGVMTPNITDAPPGSDANKLGQAAWGVLSKNYYFSEKDKSYIANTIARRLIQIEALKVAQKENERLFPDDYEEGGDAIFSRDFRRGYAGYLAELRAERRAVAEGKGKGSRAVSTLSDGITDWDQDAVADEDDFYSEYVDEEEEDRELQDEEEEEEEERVVSNEKILRDEEPSTRKKKQKKGGGNRRRK